MDTERQTWGLTFLVSGVVALLTLVLLAANTAVGLPLSVAAWSVTTYAGYRVWKASHPGASVWRELRRRARKVAAFGLTVAALLVAKTFPLIALLIFGLWLGLMTGLFVLLSLAAELWRRWDDWRRDRHFR